MKTQIITKEKVLLLWGDQPRCDHHSTSSREASPQSIPWAGGESHSSGELEDPQKGSKQIVLNQLTLNAHPSENYSLLEFTVQVIKLLTKVFPRMMPGALLLDSPQVQTPVKTI